LNINSLSIAVDTPDIGESDKLIDTLVNYFFWCLLILYTNPGGIVEALKIYYVAGKVNLGDLLFVLLSICYFIIPKEHTVFDIEYLKVRKYLTIFLIYYLVAFIVVVPIVNGNQNYSLADSLIKSRYTVYAILLSIYIYEFFKRRWDIFLKVFLFSSIVILALYIVTVITKINILPIGLINRGFVNINRNMMVSEGIMPLLVPLGVIVIVFNLRIKFRKVILTGFALMSMAYLLELWRRNIVSIFIFLFLAALADAFISKRYMVVLNNGLKIILLITSLALISYLLFPRYIDAAMVGIQESFSVMENSRDMQGQKDVRLTLDRPFINEQFYQHPFFGTGFDNRWRTKGGDNQGYEAADYPFLSALAMFGIVGLVVFLPIYIVIVRILKLDFEYLRTNNSVVEKSLLFLFVIAFMLYFAFDLVQYFNYFQAVSNSDFYYNWYIFLSLYLAARAKFYSVEFENNKLEPMYMQSPVITKDEIEEIRGKV
jgi:hypothetical protein